MHPQAAAMLAEAISLSRDVCPACGFGWAACEEMMWSRDSGVRNEGFAHATLSTGCAVCKAHWSKWARENPGERGKR